MLGTRAKQLACKLICNGVPHWHREVPSRCDPRPSARRVRDTDAGGNRWKRRLFALALALLLAVSLPVSALAATWYLEDGDITIRATESGQTVSQGDQT